MTKAGYCRLCGQKLPSGPWGAACKRHRESRELSRNQMAKLAGMTATTYGRIERGLDTQTRKLQKIADALGVPLIEVLG